MFRKIISAAVSVVLLAVLFSGCAAPVKNDKISVVCTIFPEYDWVRQVVGETDNAEVTLLLDSGTDLHNYQPTAEDIMRISECDIFIYVGGESDKWADEVLSKAKNKDMRVINLMDVMGERIKEEEHVEGMEENEDEHEHDEHAEEVEYDEHVWLSLKNAELFCEKITDELCSADSVNSEVYKRNCDEYTAKLDALDREYESMVSASERQVILFGDRFPFRYLVDDYGIDYYAAFAGCSAETEASFETIIFLANKTDELSLPVVFGIDGSDGKIAGSIIGNTKDKNQKLLSLNSMQAVTASDVENGAEYLAIMEENLDALKEALN